MSTHYQSGEVDVSGGGDRMHVCGFMHAIAMAIIGMASLPIAATAQRDTGQAGGVPKEGFLVRFIHAYRDDWRGSPDSGAQAPVRRGPPSPLDSPPFPNADWAYGGAPDIGAPNTNAYPLMTAIWGGASGQSWKASGVQVYGWLEPSFNLSTSRHTNFPEAYDVYPNRPELDQAVVYVERVPNTVQTGHIDWGFRVTAFYGADYRFTTAKGYFSQQLLQGNAQYGFDPVMEYADIYIPKVAEGLTIRAGRFISIPDIEAQLAPNNYTFTHSLLYTIDPFTDTGIIGTVKLSDHWLLQLEGSAGHDVAPWTHDATPSVTACVAYTFDNNNDEVYPCVNGLNDGKYRYNNLQMFVATWYHRFSPSVHMATESWYMYERDVPNVAGNVADPITPETGANGAFCAAGQRTCFAPEWAAVNYVEKEFSTRDFLSVRNDYLDDMQGQRTGFKTRYSEHDLMFGHWIGSTVTIRPELRFERAYDVPAYDGGTAHNQFSFATDLIFHF